VATSIQDEVAPATLLPEIAVNAEEHVRGVGVPQELDGMGNDRVLLAASVGGPNDPVKPAQHRCPPPGTASLDRIETRRKGGAKYPLVSKKTSVGSEAYILMAPLVPAGTMALAVIRPSRAFRVETATARIRSSGRPCPGSEFPADETSSGCFLQPPGSKLGLNLSAVSFSGFGSTAIASGLARRLNFL
jgi:hypothetical protein